MAAILPLDGVDATKTISNDIVEVNKVLGIEAARSVLINEVIYVLSVYGIYINNRHLGLLADLMTSRGFLTPINRHGVNKVVEGPIRRATFEETVEILF